MDNESVALPLQQTNRSFNVKFHVKSSESSTIKKVDTRNCGNRKTGVMSHPQVPVAEVVNR